MVQTANGPVRALRPPAICSDWDDQLGAVPSLGEHSDSILRELGYTIEVIERLHDANTV